MATAELQQKAGHPLLLGLEHFGVGGRLGLGYRFGPGGADLVDLRLGCFGGADRLEVGGDEGFLLAALRA